MVNGALTIRWARPEDEHVFAEVVGVTRRAAYQGIVDVDTLERAMVDSPLTSTWGGGDPENVGILLAVMDQQVVGGVHIQILPGGEGELDTFYVLPAYQRRGIGQALWNASLDVLRAHGAVAVQAWPVTEATFSRRFYERQGCVVFAEGAKVVGAYTVPHVGYRMML